MEAQTKCAYVNVLYYDLSSQLNVKSLKNEYLRIMINSPLSQKELLCLKGIQVYIVEYGRFHVHAAQHDARILNPY